MQEHPKAWVTPEDFVEGLLRASVGEGGPRDWGNKLTRTQPGTSSFLSTPPPHLGLPTALGSRSHCRPHFEDEAT